MTARLQALVWTVALLSPGCGAPTPTTDISHRSTTASQATPSAASSPGPGQARRVVFETPTGPVTVQVEVVATPASRAKGLMGRESLAAGLGMLFVFDTLKVQTFWMRKTLISLDMIFIAGEPTGKGARVVGVVHEAAPRSTQIRSVEQASRFVVEVPGGWAAAQGIGPGVEVRFDAAAQ